MRNMPMCPMMMAQMNMMPSTMPMGTMPMGTMPMGTMPMGTMPMMQPGNMCMIIYEADDKDEQYFAGMHGENCHVMMPYVKKTVDKMEQKGDMIYKDYPDKEMFDTMLEDAYKDMVHDMPEMADETDAERQFFGRRRIARDLLGILLINELLGRRRRRRRRHYDYDYPVYGYDDYYYYD